MFKLFNKPAPKMDLTVLFHKECNGHVEHGTIVADHKMQSLKNEPVRFAFANVEQPPVMTPQLLAHVFECAEAKGYVVLKLRSYADVFAHMAAPNVDGRGLEAPTPQPDCGDAPGAVVMKACVTAVQRLLAKRERMLYESLKSDVRIGMTPNMNPAQRHGTVWFEVDGFGAVKRDFQVDVPDLLAMDTRSMRTDIIAQVMLLDKTLPKKKVHCRPINIDISVGGVRRIYEYDTFKVLLEQNIG